MKNMSPALIHPVLALPRIVKRMVVLGVDASLCLLTVWLSFYLRLGELVDLSSSVLVAMIVSVTIALPIFITSGLYRAIFRYSGWPALLAVAKAVSVYGLAYALVLTVIGVAGIPRTIGIIQPILLLLFVGASRALAKLWLGDVYLGILKRASRSKALIYGAGVSGRQLAAALSGSSDMKVVGFIDDDIQLQGQMLNGLPVYSPPRLEKLVNDGGVGVVLLAMPGLSRQQRNAILAKIRMAHVEVRTLPSVLDLAQGKLSVEDLQELDIDDLLGREPVVADQSLLRKSISGKTVLVTGAGGSIGSELCRQILDLAPVRLLLVEQSEFALYSVSQELSRRAEGRELVILPLLASVQDALRMREIMSTWRPDTVYHAAAYKHVPLVEHNPVAGIKNNLYGTVCVALAAIENGVSNFVLVSTDKAVRPTNIMGASKRLAEMALQALGAAQSDTTFCMVRFGNVLGSSGSVVPKFREQIRNGGPITLTHPEVTRYFMTIPEASQLVIQAGAMAQGGDVFLLDMGEPVRIADLAKRIVELSGLKVKDKDNPKGDIEIAVTGLRPGEKLFEELLIGDDPVPTDHLRIMKAMEEFIPWDEFQMHLNELEVALNAGDMDGIRRLMRRLVVGYNPAGDIVDWVYSQKTGLLISQAHSPSNSPL